MKLKIKFNPCFFGHNWTKWEQQNANTVRLVDGWCISYIATKRVRTCKDCGYTQKQKISQ
jgi:hypothetical protein